MNSTWILLALIFFHLQQIEILGSPDSKLCVENTLALFQQHGLVRSLHEFGRFQDSITETSDLATQALLEEAENNKLVEFRNKTGVPEIQKSHLLEVYALLKNEEKTPIEILPTITTESIPAEKEAPVLGGFHNRHYYPLAEKPLTGTIRVVNTWYPPKMTQEFNSLIELSDGKAAVELESGVLFLNRNANGVYENQNSISGLRHPKLTMLSNGNLVAGDANGDIFLIDEIGIKSKAENTGGWAYIVPPLELHNGTIIAGDKGGFLRQFKMENNKLVQLSVRSHETGGIVDLFRMPSDHQDLFLARTEYLYLMEAHSAGITKTALHSPDHELFNLTASNNEIIFFNDISGKFFSARPKYAGGSFDILPFPDETKKPGLITIIDKDLVVVTDTKAEKLRVVKFDPATGNFLKAIPVAIRIPEGHTRNLPSTSVALGNGGFILNTEAGLMQYERVGDSYQEKAFIPSPNLGMMIRLSDGTILINRANELTQIAVE